MHALRRLFPRSGPAYELFDCGVFVAVFGGLGYVATDPTGQVRKALQSTFYLAHATVWGLALVAIGAFAALCAYLPWAWFLRLGYLLLTTTTFFWALQYVYGIVVHQAPTRTWLSVLVFSWVTSRLIRERGALEHEVIHDQRRHHE